MVVISDLVDMSICDPQIEAKEARYLINEIVNSITTKSRALEDVLVIMSLPYSYGDEYYHNNKKPSMSYNRTILPRFDKCIELMNSKDNKNKMIDIKIKDNKYNNNVRMTTKNITSDFHNSKLKRTS